MIESLIAHLFFLREVAHRAHLRTGSYAQHMALGAFYSAIGDHGDSIAEAWMGRVGQKVGPIPFVLEQIGDDVIATLEAQRDWIDTNRSDPSLAYSELQNLIDGAVDTIDSTIYKLRELS